MQSELHIGRPFTGNGNFSFNSLPRQFMHSSLCVDLIFKTHVVKEEVLFNLETMTVTNFFANESTVLSGLPFDLISLHQTDTSCGKPPLPECENKRKIGKPFGTVMWQNFSIRHHY